MNRKLLDGQIRSVYEDLLGQGGSISGRQLRAELTRRFGSGGKKDRVYALWRSWGDRESRAGESRSADLGALEASLADARRQIGLLETALFEAEQRALRAEERERIHQDHWAQEIDRLRQQVQQRSPRGS
jgi:hypothetical protein